MVFPIKIQHERHVRKLEALQVQLRRYEEETANLNRVLDEQRKGIEERDQLIRQLRNENVGYTLKRCFEHLHLY